MEKKQNNKLNLWALAAFLLTGLQVNSAIALDTVNAQTAIDNGMSVLELQRTTQLERLKLQGMHPQHWASILTLSSEITLDLQQVVVLCSIQERLIRAKYNQFT